MTTKNFKIAGGLALGDYALTANGLSLLWDGNAIASESYVDTAISGAAVNTAAIAGSGLFDDSGELAVNTNVIATKSYVDGVAQGLDIKASVYLATTAELSTSDWTYSNGTFTALTAGLSTFDGFNASALGNRILVKNQGTLSQNGIYEQTTLGSSGRGADTYTVLTRTADAIPDDNGQIGNLNSGAFTFVELGTLNGGKGFVALTSGNQSTWTQFSEAGSLTAGSNIYLESGAINVNVNSLVGDLDGSGLYVDGNQLAVNTNVIATKEYVDSLAPNTNAIAESLASSTLYVSGGDDLEVNTNAIAGSLASSTLYVTGGDDLEVNVNALITDLDNNGYLRAISDEVTLPGTGDFTITSSANIILNAGAGLTSYLDSATAGNEIATFEYVTNALATVNTNAIAESLASSTLYVGDGDNLNVNVNAIVGDLDGEGLYVVNDQLAINTNVVVTLTGTQDLSNKRIIDTLYFTDGVTVSNEAEIAVRANTHEFDIQANDGDLNLSSVANNINITSPQGSIILDANALSYIGSVATDNEIATKGYVDGVAQGLDVKQSVIAATTIALAAQYSNGVLTSDTDEILLSIDDTNSSYSLNIGSRVLVKDRSNQLENGIYVVTDLGSVAGQGVSGSPWILTRSDDADVPGTNLTSGAFTFVELGSNAGKGFVANVIVGQGTQITWSQFSEAGSLTAGSNIYLSSGSINVNVNSLVGDLASSSLYVSGGTELEVNTNAIVGSFASSTLYVSGGDDLEVNTNAIVGDLDGSGLYVSGNQLAVNVNSLAGNGLTSDGTSLSLDTDVVITSVSLTDAANDVTASSDVFGNGSTAEYAMGSNQTVGTLPNVNVADVFLTIEDTNGSSRTSRLTTVLIGGDSPTWTEYGIVDSFEAPNSAIIATVSFDGSRNIIVNVTGASTYSVKGVYTTLA